MAKKMQCFPGSAETLVRRGDIANDHLIAYSLSNISATNNQNRLMFVEVIVCNISVVFETQCTITSSSAMAERQRELGDFKRVGHFEAKF